MERRLMRPGGIVDLGIPNYIHGLETGQPQRWAHLSGQVGLAPDGTLGEGFAGQCRQAFANIETLLRDAGMGLEDAVMLRIYMLRREDLPAFRQIRGEVFGGRLVPSTLVFVSGLVGEDWLIELEVVAAA